MSSIARNWWDNKFSKWQNVMSCDISTSMLERRHGQALKTMATARLYWSALYFAIAVSLIGKVPQGSVVAIFIVVAVGLLTSLFYCKVVARFPSVVSSWLLMSITIDILMLSWSIYSFGEFRTYKTVAYLMYFMLLELSTRTDDVDVVKYAVFVWFASYTAIVIDSLAIGSITLTSITGEMTTDGVSLINIALRYLLTGIYAYFLIDGVKRRTQ